MNDSSSGWEDVRFSLNSSGASTSTFQIPLSPTSAGISNYASAGFFEHGNRHERRKRAAKARRRR